MPYTNSVQKPFEDKTSRPLMHAQYNEQPADSLFYNKNGFPGYSGKSISQTRSSEEKSFLQVHNNDWKAQNHVIPYKSVRDHSKPEIYYDRAIRENHK